MVSTDAELIARTLMEADHQAFGELVLRYQSSLRAWLRRLTRGDAAWADDLAQETFIAAYSQLRGFRHEGRFSTWLFTIAHRRFCTDIRRREEFVELEEAMLEELNVVEDGTSPPDPNEALDRGLALLSSQQRAAITLCYQQGLTHQEAASVLNLPLGTLKTHISRGKSRLKHYFEHIDKVHQ